MKNFITSVFAIVLFTSSAMAFNLPSVDSKEAKLKACMLQEAKQALVKGTLNKDNIETQATTIAASCAAKSALKNDPATVELATTVIKSVLK